MISGLNFFGLTITVIEFGLDSTKLTWNSFDRFYIFIESLVLPGLLFYLGYFHSSLHDFANQGELVGPGALCTVRLKLGVEPFYLCEHIGLSMCEHPWACVNMWACMADVLIAQHEHWVCQPGKKSLSLFHIDIDDTGNFHPLFVRVSSFLSKWKRESMVSYHW